MENTMIDETMPAESQPVVDLSTAIKSKKISDGEIILSTASVGKAICILHKGKIMVEQTVTGQDKPFPIVGIRPNQYFGWESYLARETPGFPVFRSHGESVISAYPYDNLKPLITNGSAAFVALVQTMAVNFNYFISFHNQIVALINQLAEENFKLSAFFHETSLTISQNTLKHYFEMAGLPNARSATAQVKIQKLLAIDQFPLRVDNFASPAKRFMSRDTSLIELFYQKDITSETIRFLKKVPRIGEISFETFMNEYNWIYQFINRRMSELLGEFAIFAGGPHSFLQQLAQQLEKIDLRKWRGFLSLVYEQYEDKYFAHPLIKMLTNMSEIRRNIRLDFSEIDVELGGMFDAPESDLDKTSMSKSMSKSMGTEVDESFASADKGKGAAGKGQGKKTSGKGTKGTSEENEMPLEVFLQKTDLYAYETPKLTDELIQFLRGKEEREDHIKRLTQSMNEIFFRGLERAAANLYIKGQANKSALRLLNYGIICEAALTFEKQEILAEFRDQLQTSYRIFTLNEWLKGIVQGQAMPSNNDLGFDYTRFMRNKMQHFSNKEKKVVESWTAEEQTFDKLSFEIRNMIASAYRMVNYSAGTSAVYPLSSINLPTGDYPIQFVTSKMIADMIDEIRSYDYMLFYREALFQVSDTTNHIIQAEILPQIIVIPAVGKDVIFWQDITGTSKQSPSRFIVPLIFSGNFRKSFIMALGQFRWELNRTVKGVSWMNPVDGGLTGEFVDYIAFYKKNLNLSFDNKTNLAQFIRSNRNNPKKMFATLYHDWIEFERRGLMRLNSVERELFFRHAPFGKKVCAHLKKIPTYLEQIKKHQFIKAREYERLQKVYRSQQDDDGNFPAAIQHYFDMLNM